MFEIDKFDFLDAYFSEEFKERLSEYESAVNIKKILKRNWKSYAFIIAGIGAIIGFILGYIGLYFYAESIEEQNPAFIIYEVIKLYVVQNSLIPPFDWQLWIAIFLCPATFVLSAIMTVIALLQETLIKIRLEFFKNHVIVCGLNKWTSQLIRDLRHSKYKQVVVISKDVDNEYKTKAQDMKVIVLTGNCSDEFLLNRANLHKAKYLVAFTEDDTKNMETAINARKLIKNKGKRGKALKCQVHIKNKHLYDAFSRHSIFQESDDNFEMNIFNNFQNDARALFLSYPFEVIAEKENLNTHILIVGFGYLGESVALQAIKMGHYANNKAIRITIIDEKAEEKGEHFTYHYPKIAEKIQSIETTFNITFLDIDLKNSQEVEEKIKNIDFTQEITSIIVCLEEENSAIQFGVDLVSMLEAERIPIKVHFPIKVYLDESEDLIKLPSGYPISPFGLIKKTCSREIILKEKLDNLAKAIHNDYVKRQLADGDTLEKNPSLVKWEDLPPDLKESNRQQADHLPIKLRALDLLIAKKKGKKESIFRPFDKVEIEKLAEMEHNRWCAERWLSGWNYTEGEKDVVKKLHPLLVPFKRFKELQIEEEQEKDRDSIRNIPEILKVLGFELFRPTKN